MLSRSLFRMQLYEFDTKLKKKKNQSNPKVLNTSDICCERLSKKKKISCEISVQIMNASQLNDLRSYSRHWLMEFIDLYQVEECLWQSKHPDYSNHSSRNRAYDKLVEKLKEVEPNPDRAMVVRKINSLRSAFRREFRKKNHKNNYETRLWYYDKLLFIADQKPKRLTDSKAPKRELQLTFDDDDSMEFEDEATPQQQQPQQEIEQHGSTTEAVVTSQGDTIGTITVSAAECVTLVKSEEQSAQQQHGHQPQLVAQAQHSGGTEPHAQHTAVKVLEITSLDSNSQREIQQAVSSLEHQHQLQQLHQHAAAAGQTTIHHQQMPTIQIAREHLQPLFGSSATYTTTATGTPATATVAHRQEDEYDAIGVNVASKLRVMNPTQRIIAEKLISDVLFNAQLDNLSVNSALTQ